MSPSLHLLTQGLDQDNLRCLGRGSVGPQVVGSIPGIGWKSPGWGRGKKFMRVDLGAGTKALSPIRHTQGKPFRSNQ